MKRHGKQQKQFMCELCGKAFLFKSSLQAHMNIHSKARPYACLTCGKAFKSKASLYTHKYVHRESQTFLCTLCGKAFKTKNCCAAHMKRHENDATYSCSQCGSTFPDKGGLSKHVKTIHVPKKHFMCKICGKKGTRGDNMRTHVKSHRNEVTETTNPVDFILEEDIPVSNSGQGFVNIRPRLRGPKQQGSRRLYIKNVTDDSKDTNEHQYQDVQTKTGITSADNISKSELPALSTLQPSLLNLPLMEQGHYNTHLSYITDDDAYMQDISAGQISGLQSGGNHLHSHQDIELYPLDQSKASYYYIPQQNELTVSDNNPGICYGPMASLLSAINPSSEQGKDISDSAYQNTLTALHAVTRQESSLSISGVYSDTEQGNISKLQQMLNQESSMHTSSYLVGHLHSDPNLHERRDQDF
ncbi:unnamed protein product [Lymnaea stagnalis]|uniref:C2H2-type domain-containing protein n=1 Tax=Lymnaea stagnalis TaxID=6523 RepID=A0AAV2GZ96_LYMST